MKTEGTCQMNKIESPKPGLLICGSLMYDRSI